MLRLKNIKKNNETIQADYYPEDTMECGFVKISSYSHEILESKLTSYDGVIKAYMSHAVTALERLVDSKSLPEERVVMWY